MELLILFIILFVYFLPTIIAYNNENKDNTGTVFLINLLFGWMIIGWIIALLMSIGKDYTFMKYREDLNKK